MAISFETTPQALSELTPPQDLELEQIQGDILIGLQKFFECFLFFEIKNAGAFKTIVRQKIIHRITTTQVVRLREFELREIKTQGKKEKTPAVGLNIGFTGAGLKKLVPVDDLGDSSFNAGAKARAADPNIVQPGGAPAPTLPINDPVDGQGNLTTWIQPFQTGAIDGVFLITGGTADAVAKETEKVLGILGNSIGVTFQETGNARPGAERGHEHFGWLDGVSQPGIHDLSTPFPGQDLLGAGLFVFGYPGGPAPKLPWMKTGSFMVFRRLKQLVPEFDRFLLDQAAVLKMDPVLLGARVVGRWKSGAPLELTPSQDDTTLGIDPQQNNDFDFADDQAQRRCPFAAHIRKTNPRSDIVKDTLDPRRIIRAGIPFGPEVSADERTAEQTQQDRGLMFVCYQTSITQQFEFVQGTWANNADFVSSVFPKHRPSDGSVITVGIDPVIGQATPPAVARATDEPIPNYPTGGVVSTLNLAQAFVVPTGGGYFFMPSISAIQDVLTTP